jgi:ABC-type polysaccharide/polyol phosphate export permease
MKFYRIAALVARDYKIFLKSRWRWLEFFYFPITSLIIWGLFAIWTGEFASIAGIVALVINVFWSYAYIVQSTVNLSINEDAWHGEAHHLFISGIGKWEYLFARIIFSLLISSVNLLIMIVVTHFFFFNLFNLFFHVILLSSLTAIISITLAIFIAGLIFMLGRDFSWLAWSALQFFILFSFPLSPLEILPPSLQAIAKIMPYGELFEGTRNLLLNKPWVENIISTSFVALIYLIIGCAVYKFGFDYSRKTGKFAKMF